MATDLTIVVEDRPGELAKVGEALGGAGINIEGFAGFGFEGRGIIHVLVEDAGAARSALEGAGVQVSGEAEALVMPVDADVDRPGALGEMARKMADAGINFSAVYLATKNRAVAVTSDNAKAMSMMM
ncbi:MAG: ACT domain-containing protein [Candidatus Velamenicoccus archaeovorus]